MPTESSSPERRFEVLIADDDREVRRFLVLALRKDGYRITEAESGNQLLEHLWERASSKASFDLIISDVRMPGYTGVEILDALREKWAPLDDYEPQLRDTPIILISAFGDLELHANAKRLGAVVLDKPFDVDELRAVAHRLVDTERACQLYQEHGGSD